MKKVFISGKMTGLPVDVYLKNFKDAEVYLTNILDCSEVINPCSIELESDIPAELMLQILKIVSLCDAVYFLNNWKQSNGSQCEYWFAQMLGIKTLFQEQS